MQLRLFLLLVAVFLLLTSREPPWADAHVVYDTTESLVDHHDFAVRLEGGVPWFYARPNGAKVGLKYGVFPLGNVLAMVPSYLAYKALRNIPGMPDRPLNATICHLSPALLMAAACMLFFGIARRRLPQGKSSDGDRWALRMTYVLAFGTIAFIYARSAYAEALQTFALTWLIERTVAAGKKPLVTTLGWLGVAAGILVNAKLVFVLVLPLCLVYIGVLRHRAGDLGATLLKSWLALVQFAAFIALALWHNHIKTGSLFDSGYQMRGGLFSGNVPAALDGFLLSPGKGFLWYSPPLLLGLLGLKVSLQRFRAETMLGLGICIMTLLFNAKFRIWHADYCWGPRHLAPLSPIILSWALPWLPEALERGHRKLRRALVGGLVGLGIFVQLLGASIYWDHYIRVLIALKDQTGAPGWFRESLTQGHYIPVFSPLVGQWWLFRHMVTRDADLERDAPWRSILPTHANLTDTWARLRLDWWPLEWLTNKEPWRPGEKPLTLKTDPPPPIKATSLALLFMLGCVAVARRGVQRELERPR